MISFFAASEGVPLAAEPVFHIGSFAVTNSMVLGVIIAALVATMFIAARLRSTLRPKSKFAFGVEQIVEFILNIAEQNFGDRKKALHHLPLLLTLFVFILFSNLTGLVPGVGTITITTDEGVVPLLRAFTTDLNATLALAILSIGMVQFYAIKELGVLGRLKHFFTDKPYNPMNFFLGWVEVLSEFIRILTLSMRLFGVIYAGEVLIHVIGGVAGNFGWAATLPIYLLEVFFSAIQAYIFVMLTTVYLATATSHTEVHEDLSESEHSPVIAPAASGSDAK
ncbi:MAG TPA: F0F1 ATP synthase subunit A [Candidatus Saccharimonadales bacterium]|nr:F0F1 ATP synthase subunit A [Candidatus Saccharimonadales bacterium]